MNNKTTISITEARSRIFQIADEVQNPAVFYTLTERGLPKMVMMSADEFDSWRETLEVMQYFPDLKKDIEEAERDIKTGAYKKYITLDELIKKQGFLVGEKKDEIYGVSNKTKTKSRKRAK